MADKPSGLAGDIESAILAQRVECPQCSLGAVASLLPLLAPLIDRVLDAYKVGETQREWCTVMDGPKPSVAEMLAPASPEATQGKPDDASNAAWHGLTGE